MVDNSQDGTLLRANNDDRITKYTRVAIKLMGSDMRNSFFDKKFQSEFDYTRKKAIAYTLGSALAGIIFVFNREKIWPINRITSRWIRAPVICFIPLSLIFMTSIVSARSLSRLVRAEVIKREEEFVEFERQGAFSRLF